MKIQFAAITLIPLATIVALSSTVHGQTPSRSVWDGIYTEAQSNRGKDLYTRTCAACHGRDLGGGQRFTALTGDEFMAGWDGFTMADLYDRIHTSMPPAAPGSLSAEPMADLMAFLLSSNRFPAGAIELPKDVGALRQIQIVSRKPEIFAQTGMANMVDHIHLFVPHSPTKAYDWYQRHFGGRPIISTDSRERRRLLFGETRLLFNRNNAAKSNAGSLIDHIAFSVPNVDATLKELEADGAKIVTPARDAAGLFKLALVDDPWGVRIEVVEDAATRGLHHVHLRSTKPAATLAWYADTFGGTVDKLKNQIGGINYGGVWILVEPAETTSNAARTGGCTTLQGACLAIDHVGFRPLNVDSVVARLKTKDVKVTRGPGAVAGTPVRYAFLDDPDGLLIELVQR